MLEVKLDPKECVNQIDTGRTVMVFLAANCADHANCADRANCAEPTAPTAPTAPTTPTAPKVIPNANDCTNCADCWRWRSRQKLSSRFCVLGAWSKPLFYIKPLLQAKPTKKKYFIMLHQTPVVFVLSLFLASSLWFTSSKEDLCLQLYSLYYD